MATQWRMLGADPSKVAPADDGVGAVPDDGPGDVELCADDWRAWQVFVYCLSAWRIVAGLGGAWYEGIEPSAMVANMQMLGIKRKHWPDVRWRLAVMEAEAAKHLNKQLQPND